MGLRDFFTRQPKKQGNSSKKDLIRTITAIGTYAKKNRYYLIFPATLQLDGQLEFLTAILISPDLVLGISCYGFGGIIEGRSGSEDWIQTLDGKRIRLASPVVKNEARLKMLRTALDRAGLEDLPCRVIGAFTSPTVTLKHTSGTGCFTENELMGYLAFRKISPDIRKDVKETAKALEAFIYRENKDEGSDADKSEKDEVHT